MLTPEYLYRISEASEEISGELHEYIVRRIIEGIMNRIGRGESYLLTARDRWMIETLQEAGYVLEDIMQEIKKKTRLQEKELKEAMEEAGIKALEYDDLIYAMADIPPTNLRASPHLIRLMQRNYEATLGTMKNFTRTTATAAQRLFLQEVDNAYTLVSTGTVSYTKAVKDAVEKIAEQGVTVVYPSGRKDTIEAATLRAVRTGIAQSTAEISLARMEETDWDIILTSAHIGARTGDGGENPGNHYWWQGRFFSRTGRTKEFPDFKTCTGYGTVEGLDGANCRHSFGPGDGIHNPFQEFDKEENRKVERLNQRQRLLERRIRKTKRELQGMKAGIDACKDEKLKFELQQDYDKKAHLLQRQNDAYSDYCKENDLKKLQDRLRIAKWDRKQAAEARGAAKRYQTAKGTNATAEHERQARQSRFSERFTEFNNGQKDTITTRRLMNNLNRTNIGKETVAYIVEHPELNIQMCYKIDHDPGVRGYQDGNDIYIFASETRTVQKTAETIVHEITHHRYNIGDSQWAECVCFAQEMKHRTGKETLTGAELKNIIKTVKELYPKLPWR